MEYGAVVVGWLHKPWIEAVLVGVAAFLVQVVLFRDMLCDFYPYNDDFPLIVNSTPYAGEYHPSEWFTLGFSEYFVTDPEISVPGSAFVRPMANLTYLVNFKLFGDAWGKYLYSGYLFQAIGCGLAYWLARGLLKSPVRPSAVCACIVYLAPSAYTVRFFPAYAFDIIAAVFVGFALLLVLKERWIAAAILLVAALFTKETAVFAPPAAAVTYFLLRREKGRRIAATDYLKAGVLACVPVGLWLAIRLLFFDSLFGKAHPTHGLSHPWTLAVGIVNGLFHWPLGYLPDGADIVGSLRRLLAQGDWSSAPVVLAIAANLIVLSALACWIVQLRRPEARCKFRRELLLLPWFLGSLAVLALLSLSMRMGFPVYLFGAPLLAGVYSKSERSFAKYYSGAILLLALVVGSGFLVRDLGPGMAHTLACCRNARQLVGALQATDGKYDRVYFVNNTVALCGTLWLKQFSGMKSDLVVVNQLNDLPGKNESLTTKVERKGGVCSISVKLDGNRKFLLDSNSPTNLSESHPVIRRNDRIYYEFPEYIKIPSRTGARIYSDLGSAMRVRLRDEGRYGVLYCDFGANRYIIQ
jgi:hypothetical protein